MKIATSPTREKFPLSHRKILKKTISRTLLSVVLLGVLYIVLAVMIGSTGGHGYLLGILTVVILGFIVLLILLVYLYQSWYFAVYYYDLTNDYIVIRKGPITPSEITIPYERIQDVYVDQDLLDRILGIYDVHLSSATVSSAMSAHIDGVEKLAADGLRSLLLKTVQERISKHKGQDVLPSHVPPPPPSPSVH